MRWLFLVVHFVAEIILFAAEVHIYVAMVRMAGFCIPRSLVSPLSSKSLSEYWGRYFFYFKEMLADIFFFPTFQRYFRKSVRIRIAFATIAAAFFGNIMFDLIPRLPEMASHGWYSVFEDFYSYTIYACILTVGLIVSQIRKKETVPEDGWFFHHVWPRIQVLGFFMILEVFDDSVGAAPVEDRIRYFFSLFGI